MTSLVVLGATGSIGSQALEVGERLGLPVVGLAARRGSEALAELARRHATARVAVTAPNGAERERFQTEFGDRLLLGEESLEDLAATADATILNGVVGAAGLRATIAALRAGNRLALANKESLVAGGPVVMAELNSGDGELIPVDSEHSALFQCLLGEDLSSIRRLVLTASGGPFRGRSVDELETVTAEEALAHPTWDMGPRITVDSATLLNKGLEVIEAHYLFGIEYERIDVVVHPQSIVHSLVEFDDGSLKAHLGEPDMRVPIQYAITHPHRRPGVLRPFELAGRSLTFEAPDPKAFPALSLAFDAGRAGGSAPAVLNAADEIAVQAFLQGRLGFMGIPEVLARTLDAVEWRTLQSVEDVADVDREARARALDLIVRCA